MTLTTLQLSDPCGKTAAYTTGEGDPVVLIHGVGMQFVAWGPQIGALALLNDVYRRAKSPSTGVIARADEIG